jgi:hypothetical protein
MFRRSRFVPWVVLLAAAAVWIGFDARASQSPASAGPYDVFIMKHLMVTMRDGVKLATDVYCPAKDGRVIDGKFPAILERTPYNKDGSAGWARLFASHGYVAVAQDVRGRYGSEGRWVPLRDDVADGYDTAKWIGGQPWSDGGIGTVGTSYPGGTQHALAISNPPYLKTMIPVDAMSNFGRYGVRHNGAFELRWFNWVLTLGNPSGTGNAQAAAERAVSDPFAVPALIEMATMVREYARALPLRPGTTPLRFAPDYEAWLIEAMGHGDYDDFWKNHGSSVVDHLAEYKDIPVLHFTGWYDSWGTQVANLNYIELRKAKKGLQKIYLGPWTHGGQARSFAGEAEFGPESALDFNGIRLRWFENWLKGADNGIDREAPVRVFVMGGGDAHKTSEGRVFVGGAWRDENEWPPARTVYTPYYLHADGVLSPEKPGAAASPITYLFDPRDPVPTLGGNISSEGALMTRGALDQRCRPDFWRCKDGRPLSSRNDILVFQTPPLDRDIEVTGRLVVKLWASSDATDTDFTAKLIDVYPPNRDFPAGIDLNIGDSIVRGRYRMGPGKAQLMVPGKPYEFTIEMYPTSLVFKKGHRIRLDISSSNFPRFDVNPNTGEPLNGNRRWKIAENTVYLDAARPSRIVLPVIPR